MPPTDGRFIHRRQPGRVEVKPYAAPVRGTRSLFKAPPPFAAILAIAWMRFAAGECAMDFKQIAQWSGLAKCNGERAVMQHRTPSLAASPKSECGHIKCDMGHAPRCHNRLANCSCLGAGRIHDRFRRRGRWLDYRHEIRVFRPGPEPQAARSRCAISRLSLPRARAPITICDQQSVRARRGFERRARFASEAARMAAAARPPDSAQGVSGRNRLLPAMSCINRILTALPMWVDIRSYHGRSISFPIGG
jgi:hypothetical protein